MKTSLSPADTRKAFTGLHQANQSLALRYPGLGDTRRPVHVMYGGAHLFQADMMGKLAEKALGFMAASYPTPDRFAGALGIVGDAGGLYERVLDKLRREPVEDYRIDFEDGYGYRPESEEDQHAVAAARELASAFGAGRLPPFMGLRIKALSDELCARAARTLDLFLTTLVTETGGRLPTSFVVTLPKVQIAAQVATLAELLEVLEGRLGLPARSVGCELMVETPQALIDADGGVALPRLVAAGQGRVSAVHFGAYDYTAALDVTAAHQSLSHPACDFARHLAQVSLAGTPVPVCDSATTILPLPRHRPAAGETLSPSQEAENRAFIDRAAKLHYDNIRHALAGGLYRGWDLHPAQLPIRYAATYAFFQEALPLAGKRLSHFLSQAARATAVGEVFDDAATGQGLLNFFLMGLACGALSDEDLRATGLTAQELGTRSFAKIVAGRRPPEEELAAGKPS